MIKRNWGRVEMGALFALVLILVAGLVASVDAVTVGQSSSRRAISRQRYRLQNDVVVIGTNGIGSLTLPGFKKGRIVVLGAAADVAFAFDEEGFAEGDIKLDMAVGSAANTDSNLTDATDKDVLQAIAQAAWTNDVRHTGISAAAVLPFDGSSTALAPKINFLTTNAIATAVTGTVSGTVWISYSQIDD